MTGGGPDPRHVETIPRPTGAVGEQRTFLLVIHGGAATMHALPDGGALVIGRAPECDVAVDDPSLSRRHARVEVGPGGLTLEDLGSQNGTRVRGEALAKGKPSPLAVGEIAELGETSLVVQRGVGPARSLRVWPHGYFEGRLEEECARFAGADLELALVVLSCEGSAEPLLDVLAPLLRPGDVVGRYGPSAIEVLLHEAGRDDAEELGRRVAEALPRGSAPTVGIACCPADGRSPHQLLAAAISGTRGATAAAPPSAIVTSGAMERVMDLAERAARGSISVLILGETGVGKEMMAERLHALSPRAERPFLRLNCGALSETLVESELFGHEKGAFTGALTTKPGLLETAEGGSVFLDEIGELPVSVQVKLLRVLEDRKVQRVGGLKARTIDVRFIAATNRALESDVAGGSFRSDLYYRIAGITLLMPPLRERRDEIPVLAQSFARRTAAELGRREPTFSREALAILGSYSWPGNVRELRNFVERAVLLCTADQILPEHLPLEKMTATREERPGAVLQAPAPLALPADDRRARIVDALERAAGNQTEAARLLGVSRRTLSNWLDLYRLPRPRKVTPAK